MRGNVERMIHDAHKLSKDMQCRYVANLFLSFRSGNLRPRVYRICTLLDIFLHFNTSVSSDMIWSLCGVSVGFLGEVVKLSEKNRWLPGQTRYFATSNDLFMETTSIPAC